ncbi:MAG: ribulose bisphosphate carboxylase small subunit [Burkholderiaceae bacterium]|nr:ribulose bisphosphate carboxylase small subunit [Burkholderiaceae bacterium]
MRITQGAFSFLPDLSDDQIRSQIAYCLAQGWAVSIEYTDDIHPRNTYWEMFGHPMFDLADPAGAMAELAECRRTFPEHYIRINAFDSSYGWETVRLSFIASRPSQEPGLRLRRTESSGRIQRYSIEPYATTSPVGQRYGG